MDGYTVKNFIYLRHGGKPYRMEVFRPAAGGKKRGAIVWFSGGGWGYGGLGVYERQCAYLARRGMVAACAEYRAIGKGPYTAAWAAEDAKAAVRWLRANADSLGIDPGRVAAAGESSGATMAAQTGLCPGFEPAGEPTGLSSVPNAMVLLDPPMDWPTLRKYFVGKLKMTEEEGRRLAPNNFLRPDMPPSLLAFSERDFLIKGLRETARLVRRMRLPVRVVRTPHQPHGFFKVTPWNEITLAWVDRFLVSLGFLRGRPSIHPPRLPFDLAKPVYGPGLPGLPSTQWWWKHAAKFRGIAPALRDLSFAPLKGGRLAAVGVFRPGIAPSRKACLKISKAVLDALGSTGHFPHAARSVTVAFLGFPYEPAYVVEKGIVKGW